MSKTIYTITYVSKFDDIYTDTDVVTTLEQVNENISTLIEDINENEIDKQLDSDYIYNGGSAELHAADTWNGREWIIKIKEHKL